MLTNLPPVQAHILTRHSFNPAVTLGMIIVKGVGIVRGILLICSQLLGAIFGSFLVSVLFPTTFNVRTTLSDGTSIARGVFVRPLDIRIPVSHNMF